jgi:hypothetical protein
MLAAFAIRIVHCGSSWEEVNRSSAAEGKASASEERSARDTRETALSTMIAKIKLLPSQKVNGNAPEFGNCLDLALGHRN